MVRHIRPEFIKMVYVDVLERSRGEIGPLIKLAQSVEIRQPSDSEESITATLSWWQGSCHILTLKSGNLIVSIVLKYRAPILLTELYNGAPP